MPRRKKSEADALAALAATREVSRGPREGGTPRRDCGPAVKVGDVVTLKGYGPKMCVLARLDSGALECGWFDVCKSVEGGRVHASHVLQTRAFHPACLRAAPDDE